MCGNGQRPLHGEQEEVACVEALPGTECEGLWVTGLEPQRRVRSLERIHCQLDVRELVELALEVEVLGVGVHPSQQADELHGHFTT